MGLSDVWTIIQEGGAFGVLFVVAALFVVGWVREWFVSGKQYREMKEDRNYWRGLAKESTTQNKEVSDVVIPAVTRQDLIVEAALELLQKKKADG